MRILIEPSDYTLLNIGDTAMLQVAVTRLSNLFPDASIQVLTDDPKDLAFYCPKAQPLSTRGRRTWLANGYLFERFYRRLSKEWLTEQLLEIEQGLRRRWPSLVELLIRFKMKRWGIDSRDLSDYLEAVSKADLVVVSGMGGITDAFPEYAFDLLDTLGLAIQRRKPTAMFGQGMGPIQDPQLRARAKAVLTRVNLISLRERRAGRPLLDSLGVSPDRVLVTGDDAIEIPYKLRPDQLGCGLGVNLRAASYSDVNQQLVEQIRPVLQDAARRYSAPMIPIPISRVPGEEDAVTIRQLMAGYPDVSNGGEELDTQLKLIQQISGCRVVVTGSYHAGVFSLAQGIPVVGLAKSDYYADKFLGLAEQFGTGCEVVSLKDAQLPITLTNAIERAWTSAEQVRPKLLQAAAQQVEQGLSAYQRLYQVVKKPSFVTASKQLNIGGADESDRTEGEPRQVTQAHQMHEPVPRHELELSSPDAPLVSVIIPCYKQAHYLGEAIESVLAQSYPHYEIVVVDDGSPDNTAEVAAKYPGVRYVRQKNQGLSGARNTGIRESKGKYLVFLDADDRLVPDALQVGINCLHVHPECAFVSGHHRYIKGDGSLLNEYPPEPIDSDRYLALLQRNYIGMHATVMYQRYIFDSVGGFDTTLKSCEDYDLYLRIARQFPIFRHDEMVAEYRWHDSNMTKNSQRMLKSALTALGSQWEYIKEKPEYVKAYKTGVRFWRNYFRENLTQRLRKSVKAGQWQQAIEGLFMLVQYSPRWLAARFMESKPSLTPLLHNSRTMQQRTSLS